MNRPTTEQLDGARFNAEYNYNSVKKRKCCYCNNKPIKLVWRPPNYTLLQDSRCWLWSLCNECSPTEENYEELAVVLNEKELFYLSITDK